MNTKAGTIPAVLRGLLAFILIVSVPLSAAAVTQEEIDALTQEAGSLAEQKQLLMEQISALSDDLSAAMDKKELLDSEIALLNQEIENLEAQILYYEEQIVQEENELSAAREQETERYALFRERVRSMEENRTDYRSVLFRASSLVDLLSRLDFVSEIMNADQRAIESLREIQTEIREKRSALADSRQALEDVHTEKLSRQLELDAQREAANQLILELEAGKEEAERGLDDLSAEEEAVQEEIIRLSNEYAEEQARAALMMDMAWYGGLTTEATLGGYAWPVYSHKINSTFGGRASPGGIGSTNHKGIDIGGVGYGTEIYASKAGMVIVSEYSSSYGNYVVISHGAGNTTLYAHMEQRVAEAGQTVEQGDLIGYTGSTGHSTGPHLHFEIAENGIRINPLIYLTDYYLP